MISSPTSPTLSMPSPSSTADQTPSSAVVEQRRRGVEARPAEPLDARPRHVVVHEHPRPPVDRRRAPRLQGGEMGLARVALVAVERPRRVVLGLGAHHPVAADLGEDAGGGDDEAAGVGLDHPLDSTDVRRHEVPTAVDDGRVRHDGQLGDRPAGSEALRRRHPQLVTFDLGGMPDAPRRAPRSNTIEQPLAVTLGEHLRVADAVQPPVGGQHRGADRERAGPRTAPDLVDADDDGVAELPQLLLDAPGRRVLLGGRPPWSAPESHAVKTTETGNSCERPRALDNQATRSAGGITVRPCMGTSAVTPQPIERQRHALEHPRRRGRRGPRRRQHLRRGARSDRSPAHVRAARDTAASPPPLGSPPTTSCSTSAVASAAQHARWRRHFGCQLVGVDVTASFCEVAAELNRRSGLDDLIEIRVGDAMALPCEDAEFTVAWTQHASMNIARKAQMYSEMRRALVTGGRLAFFDVLAGEVQPAHLPLPWADDESQSVLATPQETRRLVTDAGFEIRQWDDVTKSAAEYVTALAQATAQPERTRHAPRRSGHVRACLRPRPQHRRRPRHVRPVRRRRVCSSGFDGGRARAEARCRSSRLLTDPAPPVGQRIGFRLPAAEPAHRARPNGELQRAAAERTSAGRNATPRKAGSPVTSSTMVGKATLRGRPRPRRTATIWPSTRNSPPQTPNGSPRWRARARHRPRTVQRAQIAFARAASAGFSEKNSGVYVERGSAHRAALAITASTGLRSGGS